MSGKYTIKTKDGVLTGDFAPTASARAKPKWVECLERAEHELTVGVHDGHESHRAETWIELARLYRG